ncbi:MAG: tRNA (adenosine(37)-N6)-dimethylallyltransferase MiaA [Blautia sp.]|uniref:tRNA dimethylallyltransferase n=1 Tax=Blautia argi TaxID=1912897 RepID=A0A2Z4UEG5_9FIRM|nr:MULTISPECIES: tRNA (adenosine(37)-N6)-dimethylallyltransferase MiaA [Blautia]AWY99445.1 tRNA (adenosine(37)-N6)-dimethylallyltransferase MiaA [Blautia argi]
MKKPLIVLTGPTAVGKTKLSIALAKAVDGEIISADSMQVYKYMDIGSAKITKEEMEGVPHHLIDVLDPGEDFHVVRFQEMAKQAMEEIYAKGKIPILAGGTGFYIQAVVKDIDFSENTEKSPVREALEKLAEEKGSEFLHERLREIDPPSADKIHANNVKRVIRALEYYQMTGERISDHNAREAEKESPYNTAYFVLNDVRERLYARIDSRVDEMLKQGLLEEVQKLADMGYTKDMVSMQGLGYKEILSYLDHTCTLEEAVYILKRDTRHFAKRQLTWFKREKDVIWVNKNEFAYKDKETLDYILKNCEKRGIIPCRK